MSGPRRVRVGLIGAGRIATIVHLGTLRRLPGIELVAVAEADPERARRARERAPGTVVVADHVALLERTEAEAVVLALPTHLHAPVAIDALARGVAVYVEKPLAGDLDEGRDLVGAWRASGAVGATGFNFRCHPLHREARARLQAGDIGRPLGMSGVFCAAARELPEWKSRRRTGGGVLLDLASHHIDLARFLLGTEPVEASCRLRSVRAEDDTATLAVRMDDDALVQGFYSSTSAEADRIELHGDEGRLVIDRYGAGVVARSGARRELSVRGRLSAGIGTLTSTPRRLADALRAGADPSFAASLTAFADAVREGTVPPADLQDGLVALAVVEAAERAAREGGPVTVEETGHASLGAVR